MPDSNHRMAVVAVDPSQQRRRRVLLAAAAAAVLAGGYALGRLHADYAAEKLTDQLVAEAARVESLEGVREELADVVLDRTVEAGASELLRKTIKEQRDEIARLSEQVDFFTRLMAPGSLPRGVTLDRFELSEAGTTGTFDYYLLITQLAERRSWVQGMVVIDVEGIDASGERQVLSLTELTDLSSYPLKYRFRYFQDFSGSLTLPEGFEAETVRVRADRQGGKDNVEREFSWADATAGGSSA